MFSQPIPLPGRRRALDRKKKQLLCDAVSRGATMTEAAVAVGVSLRTVQREARLDSEFDQALRIAHTDKAHPLDLMESAARTHWRAAAWLLERTNPEKYGRRPALSCTPFQFEEALKVVVEAALRLAPEENRSKVYAKLTEASETAFKAVFPTCGPCGRRLVERLPDTPLADHERRRRETEPQFQRVIFEGQWGYITEPSLHEQPPRPTPDPAAAPADQAPEPDATPPSKPPALPGDRRPLKAAATIRQETPGQRPGLQHGEPANAVDRVAATPTRTAPFPTPAPEFATPDARLPWHYNLRVALTSPAASGGPDSGSLPDPPILSQLSPKTGDATEFKHDRNPPATR